MIRRAIPFPFTLLFPLLLLLALLDTAASDARGAVIRRPKLVVVLVIDQFRADYLLRFESRFLPATGKSGDVGGFEYLMSKGSYFPIAEYGILQSMTAPGHATILTGSYPYQSGIPTNYWYNTAEGKTEYGMSDDAYPVVGVAPYEHSGLAPTRLFGDTVGDELKNAGWSSRVVTLAVKDRAAMMLGGRRPDLAFWIDHKERAWVSSSYYLPDGKLPGWLSALNREIQPKAGQKAELAKTTPASGLSDEGYRPARPSGRIGPDFPHELPMTDDAVLALPYGLELTEQAAERAIDAYRLGTGAAPDLLAVSFSSHDYVGHAFGPNSREMEEMTVREDRLISKLLNHVRKKVPGGLRDVVIALTGDHGAPPDPLWAKTNRLDAGTINTKDVNAEIEALLNKKFGEPKDVKWVGHHQDFNVWFNRRALESRKADLGEVTVAVKALLASKPGVAHVVSWQDYEQRKLPPGQLGEQVLRTYFPGRSGDLIVIPRPYWTPGNHDTVNHLTGYSYDRMVPLVLAGSGIRAAVHPAHVRVIDLAPTLSHLLGTLPPSLSEGRVLTEALETKRW